MDAGSIPTPASIFSLPHVPGPDIMAAVPDHGPAHGPDRGIPSLSEAALPAVTDVQKRLQAALQHHQAGQLDAAAAAYREVLHLDPDQPAALHFLGIIHFQQGRLDEAYRLVSRAVEATPRNARYHISLALICQARGRRDESRRHLNTAATLAPQDPEVYFHLANDCMAAGEHRQAAAHYRQTLSLAPRHALAWNNLGKVHQATGDLAQAQACFQRAIDCDPALADACFDLGDVLRAQGQFTAARQAFASVLRLQPRNAAAHANLGTLLKDEGRIDEALTHYRRALEIEPTLTVARDNLLFVLSYHVLGSAEERLAAHREWERAFTRQQGLSFHHGRHEVARLRIGYVSPDFRRHPVNRFFEPLLAAHDREAFEIFCYAQVNTPDDVTRRLQAQGDHWRFTTRMDDAALARAIFEDGIHILVDLAGHTAGNRLGAFVYRPAPVQATYLGYCATTGLSTMDYWITDAMLMPPDSPELSTETALRLPRCWITYQPPADCLSPAPRRGGGEALTFGSFNHYSKITPAVVSTWSRILRELPRSKLMIKNQQMGDPALQEALRRRFAAEGIHARRLRLEPASADYMAAYNEVDIGLDPFPRTGGATTADALWMGVPVITLAGQFLIERQGLSMLTALGLEGDLCATSTDEYVRLAVELARAPGRRQELHRSLRRRMTDSPLCDHGGLARALESAYRTMWQGFLEGRTLRQLPG